MKRGFDPKCLDLVRYFYPEAPLEWAHGLAQDIQDVIERENAYTEYANVRLDNLESHLPQDQRLVLPGITSDSAD